MSNDAFQDLLTRGVEKIHVREHLEAALKAGKKLRVKHGIDPTGAKLHLGHAATLWKLREFQDLGHQVVIIIGDYTAQIGDPSDKLQKRPFLTQEQIKENMKTYKEQIGKILDIQKIEWHYNSEWLEKLSLIEFSRLADLMSVQQVLHRRNFAERWARNEEITARELHYPLYQGYDSVIVRADVEIGGNDQLFNLLVGRKIQESYGQAPQDVITTTMLIGLDGEKMSKSSGNIINLLDQPQDMYGKIMSLRDEIIPDYFWLVARTPQEKADNVKKALRDGVNPRDLKMELAHAVVTMYHSTDAAVAAQDYFVKIFQEKEIPEELTTYNLQLTTYSLADLLVETKLAPSKSEARRLIVQGGVKINGVVKKDPTEIISFPPRGLVLQKGKREFVRVVLS